MIHIADINDVGMYHVRETGSFGRLDGKSCTNCRESLYSIFLCMSYSAHIEKKNYCEQYWKICEKTIM